MPEVGKNTVVQAMLQVAIIRKHKYEQMMGNANDFLLISQNVGNPQEYFSLVLKKMWLKVFPPIFRIKSILEVYKATMGLLDLQHPTGKEKEEYYYYLPIPLPGWTEFQKKTKLDEQITFLCLKWYFYREMYVLNIVCIHKDLSNIDR